jgi:thiamine-monophosphate kinase
MGEKRTEIAELGEFGLIERLTRDFGRANPETLAGVGDDAAVIAGKEGEVTLLSTDLMLEGVDFDLVYFPLKHLGYKAVVAAASDILAMNGMPRQITVSIGVSAKLGVEQLDEFYAGVRAACEQYGIDLAGGDTSASVNGFVVSVTVMGATPQEKVAYRSGARQNDLICITGDLGSAYMGLHLLEREKRALEGHPDPKPEFEGYEYLLERYLRPVLRKDIIESLAEEGLQPTSMIDLSDGLASDLLQICKSSECGARIYLDRIPIARETYALAEELHVDPVVAALNGGNDYQLMFTVPLEERERIAAVGGIDIIGHITPASTGAALTTPDGSEIAITAPGFRR